jgi:hypothetical protein
MLIRLEKTRYSTVLIIDEVDRFIGEIDEDTLWMECIDINLEPLIEDDYIFYLVDKNCLNKLLER